MEKLAILGEKHLAIKRGGNTVLYFTAPTVSGNTPAARHVSALLAALEEHANGPGADRAEAALIQAVRAGKLFRFSRTVHRVTVRLAPTEQQLFISLSLCCGENGGAPIFHRLLMCWDKAELVQIPLPGRKIQKICPKALQYRVEV